METTQPYPICTLDPGLLTLLSQPWQEFASSCSENPKSKHPQENQKTGQKMAISRRKMLNCVLIHFQGKTFFSSFLSFIFFFLRIVFVLCEEKNMILPNVDSIRIELRIEIVTLIRKFRSDENVLKNMKKTFLWKNTTEREVIWTKMFARKLVWGLVAKSNVFHAVDWILRWDEIVASLIYFVLWQDPRAPVISVLIGLRDVKH